VLLLAGAATAETRPAPKPTPHGGAAAALLAPAKTPAPPTKGSAKHAPAKPAAGNAKPAAPAATPAAPAATPEATPAAPATTPAAPAATPEATPAAPATTPAAPAATPEATPAAPDASPATTPAAGDSQPTPTPAAGDALPVPATQPAPADFVRAYYTALDKRQFADAWKRLSPAVKARFGTFARWRAGYATTVASAPESIKVSSAADGSATVRHVLVARDRTTCGGTREQRFAVTWTLVPADSGWTVANLTATAIGSAAQSTPCQ
jgi:hypothetical protein